MLDEGELVDKEILRLQSSLLDNHRDDIDK